MNSRIKAMLETFTPEEIRTGILENQKNKAVETTTPTELERTFKAELLARNAGTLLRQARETRGKSLSKLGSELGISKGRVHQREQASANLEIKTILEQAEALEYEVELVLRPKHGGQEIRALL
jgi:ribosome-binding protein aMBF1 (putative translation factor)